MIYRSKESECLNSEEVSTLTKSRREQRERGWAQDSPECQPGHRRPGLCPLVSTPVCVKLGFPAPCASFPGSQGLPTSRHLSVFTPLNPSGAVLILEK